MNWPPAGPNRPQRWVAVATSVSPAGLQQIGDGARKTPVIPDKQNFQRFGFHNAIWPRATGGDLNHLAVVP